MPSIFAENIATLIAADRYESGIISEAADALDQAGCDVIATNWIDDGKAFDIVFSGEISSASAALEPFVENGDIAIQRAANRRKMMLISDMDSTMITVECIDELADYAGIKPQIAEITERAMQGELDFSEALRSRVALLSGLDIEVIETCLSERVRPMPGARILVQTMAGWGAHTVLVSGGFVQFANPVAAHIGFAAACANVMSIADGKLTGTLDGPIVDADAKRDLLLKTAHQKGIDPSLIIAVGDGANDIPMIAQAIKGGGIGASYHAKPKAEAAANFAIRHNDLTALLYAQGVKSSDWIKPD
jgi:phosphoserine phosphatase